ncbi:hypothetical protein OJAV_G00022770 [Oryzias javanicus]|uniref:KASH5-like coiled-coil domain-containing protein n=1 Tax=Oryzias javanicus TaxID=123683 RepID=A0A3S2MU87_ORYJA|nr:hypothetical protein OJAV_G00022770 [Oryzias javanicus]
MSDGRDGFEVWESSACMAEDLLEDNKDGFSEHELLDVMYDTCKANNSEELLASNIIQYLQSLTAQSVEQERLSALRLLLDPDCQDPEVNRETFHSTMKEWIAQCSHNSLDVGASGVSWPDSSKISVNRLDSSLSKSKECMRDEQDLWSTVAELKQAHQQLNKQRSSLLRMVAQCEDVNLQLSVEVTELQAQLDSAQRSTQAVRFLKDELEETQQILRETQERAGRTQSSFSKLSSDVESLKVYVKILEDKNKTLSFEKTGAEDDLNKLKKINSELRDELEETLLTLTLRGREIAKKDKIMDKMKSSHVENHKIIKGLQAELVRLLDHSQDLLMRYDRHCIKPQGVFCVDPPNLRSLQSELQDTLQLNHSVLDDRGAPSLQAPGDYFQNIIHKIKREGLVCLERDSTAVERRPFLQCHQSQANIKQQLVSTLQGLHRRAWEEKGEKVDETLSMCEREQKKIQPEIQSQIQEDKRVAAVYWCSTQKVERRETKEIKSIEEQCEGKAKVLQSEEIISDTGEKDCHLGTPQRSGPECAERKNSSRTLGIQEKNARRREAGLAVGKEVKDQRVKPLEIPTSEREQTQMQEATDGFLATLKRMEAMVSSALETAELVRQGEQRVSQVRQKMEIITQKVQDAVGHAASTDKKLKTLEALVNEKTPTQSSDPRVSPVFEMEGNKLPPECPEAAASLQLSMNGATDRDSCSESEWREISRCMCVCFATALWQWTQLWQEEKRLLQESLPQKGDLNLKKSCDVPRVVERPFGFRHSSPSLVMPTLPEEDEESPEEMDSSSSSPRTSTPSEGRTIVFAAPTIIYPQQVTAEQVDRHSLEQARPHSPRARLARKPSGGPITTVDSTGNVIDLLRDSLPEPQLSEEDRQKNLELLEQAKKVSDRFLSRRGRRSTSSLTESPTGLSPCPTPPSSSPSSSRSSSVIVAPQTASSEMTHVSSQSAFQYRDVSLVREQSDSKSKDLELLVEWKPSEKRKVSSGTLTPRFAVQKENSDLTVPKSSSALSKADEVSGRNPNQAPATGVAKPVPRPPTQQAPCTAEIKTIGAFPPLMRAVSWDAVGSINSRNGSPSFLPTLEEPISDEPREAAFKSSGYKDFPTQPGGVRKLTKLREEHKLMRNQSIVGSKLPELSETTEQEKGTLLCSKSGSIEEGKENAMPNISDVMLRKLKLHRGLPGCAPPLSEKEVENAFVQLSLAFRNDNYTLETRLKQAERERNLTEEETEKELEEFKGALKMTSPQWQNMEQRDAYQRLIETVAVLHRLATRLSSRAEIVGAVRQEKRMNKATEVMMQYVENLKRIYEKDHAELMEFKKLANQNSNRCYTGTVETGDDGVPRTSRAMSLTLGKALPRRRVSVAVVPKFSLINAPGQTPATAPTAAALPALCETNDVKSSSSSEGIQPAAPECGKTSPEQENESAKPSTNLEEIRAEIRAEIAAKIEEEAYQRGLKEGQKQSKVILEDKCEEETDAEKQLEHKNNDEELGKRHHNMRRMEEAVALLGRLCPKVSISRRLLWIALTLFVVMCVVISIFTFFSDYYKRREDT